MKKLNFYNELNEINLFTLGIDGTNGKLLSKPIKLKNFSALLEKNIFKKEKSPVKNYFVHYYESIYSEPVKWQKTPLNDIKKAGWVVIVNKNNKDLIKILSPLIKKREGKILYYENQPPYDFVLKIGDWDADYTKIPYYILLAGSIQEIPLQLQYLLDVRHAVGRIYFDNINDYEKYVEKLLNYTPDEKKSILFFSPVHSNQDPTFYSNKYLVKPLLESLTNVETKLLERDNATEEKLFNEKRYRIIFTASHGLGLPKNFKEKEKLQGAIVCQDIKFGSNLLKENKGLITGLDIELGNNLNCDILFMFGCYTAGTLKESDFKLWLPDETKSALSKYEAVQDFIAYLPQKLLSSKEGPYVVIAHIDPAWVFSFMNEYQNTQRIEPFKNALKRLLSNVSAGRSMRDFNFRYATLSVALLNYVIDHLEKNEKINPLSLSNIWVTRQDAQNYIILGDPAFSL